MGAAVALVALAEVAAVAAAEAAAAAAPVDGAAEEAADSGLEQSLDTVPEPEEMWTKETVSLHVRFGEFITFLRGENEDLEWEMDNAPETIEAWKDWLKESVPAVTDVASTGVAADTSVGPIGAHSQFIAPRYLAELVSAGAGGRHVGAPPEVY